MGLASWKGRADLKRDVLAQLAAHREAARLAPILIDDDPIEILGWPGPANLPALRDALGLPVSLLSLGFYLFDGFPENDDGIRDLIDEKTAFLEAIPIGLDLEWVVWDFVFWRLTDAETGLSATVDDVETRGHVETVALAVSGGESADRAPIEETLGRWRAEIPRQWQRDRRVEPKVYQHVRTLEATLLACELARDPALSGKFAETSLYGAFGTTVMQSPGDQDAAMRTKLVELLAEAERGELQT